MFFFFFFTSSQECGQVLGVAGVGVPLEARPLESGGAHKSGGATLEVVLLSACQTHVAKQTKLSCVRGIRSDLLLGSLHFSAHHGQDTQLLAGV
jgi:hypothetical protein